jgi:hypothetical protein
LIMSSILVFNSSLSGPNRKLNAIPPAEPV